MAFKSSQNHVRPHILYIIGKRMTSAMTMTMTKTHTKTNTETKTSLYWAQCIAHGRIVAAYKGG